LFFLSSVLLIFIVNYFLKERMIMPDAAFHLFYMIKNEGFAVQNYRFSIAPTQLPIWLALKFDVDLHTIIKIYSNSLILPLVFVQFLLVFLYRNYNLSLVFIIVFFLMNTHSLFFAHGEIFHGFSYLLLLFTHLDYLNEKKRLSILNLSLFVFIAFLVVFSHPLIVIPFFYIIGYHWLGRTMQSKYLTLSLICFAILFLANKILFSNEYDSGAFSHLKNIFTLFPNYISQPSFQNFYTYLVYDYYLLIPFSIAIVVYYLKNKLWLNAMYFILSLLGVLFIINITYYKGAEQFYLEGQYTILTFIIALPFVYEIIPKIKSAYHILIFGSILILFCIRIHHSSKMYSQRIELYSSLISKYSNQKVILPLRPELTKVLKMSWGSSYEVWLLSTTQIGKTNSLIVSETIPDLSKKTYQPRVFLTPWEVFEYENLNPKYFKFSDTGYYIVK